jgi:hypothetical protein
MTQCPALLSHLRRKVSRIQEAVTGSEQASDRCLLDFTACVRGGDVEVYDDFVFHESEVVSTGRKSWYKRRMQRFGNGSWNRRWEVTAGLRRVGDKGCCCHQLYIFGIFTCLTLSTSAQKYLAALEFCTPALKKKLEKLCFFLEMEIEV